jgi:hypothetical protein
MIYKKDREEKSQSLFKDTPKLNLNKNHDGTNYEGSITFVLERANVLQTFGVLPDQEDMLVLQTRVPQGNYLKFDIMK